MTANVSPKTGMTRAETFAWVKALRADGWTNRQIARELECGQGYVRDLLTDPTGEKARERKRRTLMRPCADCSTPAWGERCEACAIAKSEAEAYWTLERLLDAARVWRERYGDWPRFSDWLHVHWRDGYLFPSGSHCYSPAGDKRRGKRRPWSTWGEYLRAAGATREETNSGRWARSRNRAAA
jgi:hypothetical protein